MFNLRNTKRLYASDLLALQLVTLLFESWARRLDLRVDVKLESVKWTTRGFNIRRISGVAHMSSVPLRFHLLFEPRDLDGFYRGTKLWIEPEMGCLFLRGPTGPARGLKDVAFRIMPDPDRYHVRFDRTEARGIEAQITQHLRSAA